MTKRMAVVILLALGLALAACGDDEKDDEGSASAAATPTVEASGPDLSGPSVNVGDAAPIGPGTPMPGCSDPNSEECPSPVMMDLDATATAEGVSVQYPGRYFSAQTGGEAPQGVLIALVPSDKNVYEQKATFNVLQADSIDAALAELGEGAEIVDWSTESLGAGKLGVWRDDSEEAPQSLTIGAFPRGDKVIVLRLATTGKYGWDLWSQLYNSMLNSLTVAG